MRISLFNTILLCIVFVTVVSLTLYIDQRLEDLYTKTKIELQLLEEKIEVTQRLIIQSTEIKER